MIFAGNYSQWAVLSYYALIFALSLVFLGAHSGPYLSGSQIVSRLLFTLQSSNTRRIRAPCVSNKASMSDLVTHLFKLVKIAPKNFCSPWSVNQSG